MSRFTEEDYRRRLVDAFIGRRPVQLVISRKVRTATPGGTGYVETPTDLPTQTFRWLPVASGRQPRTVTAGGQVTNMPVQLEGSSDADVQVGDTITTPDGKYRVEHIDPVKDVRVLADLVYLGK
jgi:hypothetical protein